MRFLGIDYGTKRIGLALSDDEGRMAFPREVLTNGNGIVAQLSELCKKEGVGAIVMGESTNFQGEDNPVMKQITVFKDKLAAATGLPIYLEPEFLTSQAAARVVGNKDPDLDARAAALILQSYLDKQRHA